MAQRRLRDYKDALSSFEHNLINLFHKAGRFTGYDLFVPLGGLDFKLQHSGITVKDELTNSIGPLGVMMTKQGVMVIEDTELAGPFTVQSNAGNNFERVDLFVANHQFLPIDGGQIVTYDVITGDVGGVGDPALTNEDYQVILGRIIMAPNATSLSTATFVKAKSPDSGDGEDARLSTPNQFATLNRFNFSAFTHTSANSSEVLTSSILGWTFKDDGNAFTISNPGNLLYNIDAIRLGKSTSKDGVEIKILLTSYFSLRSKKVVAPVDIARGFDPIVIPSIFGNDVSFTDYQIFLKPPAGESWLVTLFRINGQWVVIGVEGQSLSPFRKGMLMEVSLTPLEISANFEPDGLGKNLYLGWQWANGLRGTLDMRCRVSVMATDGPNTGASVLASQLLSYTFGETGGTAMMTLSSFHMPEHSHFGLEANHSGHATSSFNYPGGTYVSLLVNTPTSSIINVNNAKTGSAGSGGPFDNRMPFRAVGKIQRLY